MTKSPFLVSFNEINNSKSNEITEFSPVSGAEPKYDPGRWNDNESIKSTHNCYAYVLDKIISGRNGKPQPGYFSGFPPLRQEDYNCDSFYKRLKKDIPSMYKTTFGKKCRKGFHKGFIALDPKMKDTDYHFYVQNLNGYWSHKPGRTAATNLDASGKLIKNPEQADRKYSYFNYNKPCFFFCMNRDLASGRSVR